LADRAVEALLIARGWLVLGGHRRFGRHLGTALPLFIGLLAVAADASTQIKTPPADILALIEGLPGLRGSAAGQSGALSPSELRPFAGASELGVTLGSMYPARSPEAIS
jgi:hypothetical protein